MRFVLLWAGTADGCAEPAGKGNVMLRAMRASNGCTEKGQQFKADGSKGSKQLTSSELAERL